MGHYYVKEDETFNTTRNGTVPKPTQEDIEGNKVLKADGTWGEGGGGGASSMADLTDVDLTGLSDGDTLVYDEEEEKFIPGSSGNVDGVEVNGESVVDENKVAKIVSYKELTRAEYDALPDTKFTDGIMYCIKDGFSNPNGFPPLIYSTEEREVGTWIDGRPLYQKTVTNISVTHNAWTTVFNGTSINAYVVECFGLVAINGGNTPYCSFDYYRSSNEYVSSTIAGSKVSIVANIVAPEKVVFCTVKYIKTTDTPGSGKWATDGGLAKHYSTQEQVVGTWIDGKPLYEKTINVGHSYASPSGSVRALNYDISALNVKNVLNAYGFYVGDGSQLPYVNHTVQYSCYLFVTNSLIQIRRGEQLSYSDDSYVTIQYTKTTD